MAINDADIDDMIENCRVLTIHDGPFRPMPSDYKKNKEHWITMDIGSCTLVINNIFHHPQGDYTKPKTILRLAKNEEKELKAVTKVFFQGTGITAEYVPITTFEEIIFHKDLAWFQQTQKPTVLIYHPVQLGDMNHN